MKSLKDIRVAVNKRAVRKNIQDVQIVNVKSGNKIKRLSLPTKVIKKTQAKVSEEKRKEIIKLNDEINIKKLDAEKSGKAIIEEAVGKAKKLIAKANTDKDIAKKIRVDVGAQKSQANRLKCELRNKISKNNIKEKELDKRNEYLEEVEIKIKKLKKKNVRATEQSKELVANLAAVLEIVNNRIERLEMLESIGLNDLSEIVDSLEYSQNIINIKNRKNNDKEEHLQKKSRQLDKKEVILKDSRISLEMAERELLNK